MNTGRDEIDGIPTLYLEDGVVQGPLQACLMFGVGRADETILTSGISHLVEHLTLRSIGPTPYGWNGAVHLVSTRFSVMGESEQVAEFLGEVARRLRELPTDRLADELKILEVEAEKRSRSQFALDLCTRFGATGAGLIDWREIGLHRLQADEIQRWAHDWFTPQNAVLWLSGPVPAGLDLAALPQGGPVVHPDARSLTADHTFVGVNTDSTSLSVLSEQQWGVIPAMAMARQQAYNKLRIQDAVCYDIGSTNERIGSGSSIDFLLADGAPDAQRQIFDGLVHIVENMAANGPSRDEVDSYKQMARLRYSDPRSWLSHLDSLSERMLLGWEELTFDEVRARTEAMTPESIAEDLRAVMPTLLATGSQEIGETDGWTLYADWSPDIVSGTTYSAIKDREQGELVVGEEGISWVCDADRRRTIRWHDAVACFTHDNGVRTVLAPTGEWVTVVPWDWQAGSNLTELVDRHVGPDRRVNLGEGDLQYLRDPQDPNSVTDVRWLASLTGAFHNQQRVDLVVDTDGILLLFERVTKDEVPQRLKELRSLDRQSLLSKNPRNRWFPATDLEEITLSRRPLARFNTLKSTLTIRTTSSEVLKVHLVNEDQVAFAKDAMPKLLGPRFTS